MTTSSNGNIFRATGPLCGEFIGSGEFPTQRAVTRSFDVFFDLRLNKRLSKQPWGWWFETPSWSLWRQCNVKRELFVQASIYELPCSTLGGTCTNPACPMIWPSWDWMVILTSATSSSLRSKWENPPWTTPETPTATFPVGDEMVSDWTCYVCGAAYMSKKGR